MMSEICLLTDRAFCPIYLDDIQQAIVYASILNSIEPLSVEVVSIKDGIALVRALSAMKDGKLVSCFPFEGHQSCARVLTKSLFNIHIYR
jgi:hypothetical protein